MAQSSREDPLRRGSLSVDREASAGDLPAAGNAFDRVRVRPITGDRCVKSFYTPYEYGFRSDEQRAWDALYYSEEGGESG